MSVFEIFKIFVLISFLLFAVRMYRYAIEVRRFLLFAKANFYETWEYLTSYKNIGSGFQINPFRSFFYFTKNEQCDDVSLEQARQRVKGRLVSAFLALGSCVGIFCLLVGYAIYQHMQR